MYRLTGESIIPAQTDLYHSSHFLAELLVSGVFNSARSNHEGAMFFTLEPTLRSNIAATASEDLRAFDFATLTPEETTGLEDLGEGNLWTGAALIGFDGRLYENPDPFAEISPGVYSVELVIFQHSLRKLTDIRAQHARISEASTALPR